MATDEVSPQAHRSGWMQHPAIRRLMVLVIAAVAIAGLTGLIQPGLGQPAVAQAYTIQGPNQVGWGRAAILFNRDETLKIGIGGLPNLPPTSPVAVAFNIAKAGLGAIAMSYYNRGLCSAYAWSVRPWDNQGFMSRKC